MSNLLTIPILLILNIGLLSTERPCGEEVDKSPNVQGSVKQRNDQQALISNLPLAIIPATQLEDYPLVFFISGDGGWSDFDQEVGKLLSEKGVPVAGLDSRKYFWKEKQPEEAASEIARVVEHYSQLWHKSAFILIGYSFGACVAPFIAEKFPVTLQGKMKGVYCLSPDLTGDFKIHIADLLNLGTVEKYDVLGEILKIKNLNPTCIFGNEEDPQEREYFSNAGIRVQLLPGEHHYNNDYKAVTELILKNISTK